MPSVEDGRVKSNVCFKMELGEKDESGRPRPIKIEGTEFEIEVDSVISAIGQRVELDFFPDKELKIDADTLETQVPGVFAGGDAVRGASTLIKAIGDGKSVAESIRRKADRQFGISASPGFRQTDIKDLQIKQARRIFGPKIPERSPDQRFDFDLVAQTLEEDAARQEARRCLQCDLICNICTTVCPNRANVAYRIDPFEFTIQRAIRSGDGFRVEDLETVQIRQSFQIINIGDFCNECGNCTTFCPTSGEPYRIKPKFYMTEKSFQNEENGYMFSDGRLQARVDDAFEMITLQADALHYESKDLRVRLNPQTYAAEDVIVMSNAVDAVDLRHAAQMGFMFQALKDFYLFK